nr:uncharacterized protein LOC109191857 [Ipomoea batatas]
MVKRGITGPILVAGDFNSVLTQDETANYSVFSLQRSSAFADWIHSEGLVDMGFSGPKLTWVKGNQSGYIKGARLDRALCNFAWRNRFTDANVVHLPRIASDHAPLLIRVSLSDVPRRDSNFRFHAAWLVDRRFEGIVRDSWCSNRAIQDNVPIEELESSHSMSLRSTELSSTANTCGISYSDSAIEDEQEDDESNAML